MGGIESCASIFSLNSRSLEEFDAALRLARQKKTLSTDADSVEVVRKLLNVMNPIIESFKGRLSESMSISESDVIDIIRTKRNRDWQSYKERVERLHSKLMAGEILLTDSDFQLLDDIADALDAECANLFRRMSER